MTGRRDSAASGGAVYFEFLTLGTTQKVTAIDAATGIEVVVLGPASATRHDLEKLALAKLKRRLAQDANRR